MNQPITIYQELLNTPEWREKRKPILERDKYKCQKCYNEQLVKNHILGYAFCSKIAPIDGFRIVTIKIADKERSIFLRKELFERNQGTEEILLFLINIEELAKNENEFINYTFYLLPIILKVLIDLK